MDMEIFRLWIGTNRLISYNVEVTRFVPNEYFYTYLILHRETKMSIAMTYMYLIGLLIMENTHTVLNESSSYCMKLSNTEIHDFLITTSHTLNAPFTECSGSL